MKINVQKARNGEKLTVKKVKESKQIVNILYSNGKKFNHSIRSKQNVIGTSETQSSFMYTFFLLKII